MDKFLRSAVSLYKVPRASHLTRLGLSTSTNSNYILNCQRPQNQKKITFYPQVSIRQFNSHPKAPSNPKFGQSEEHEPSVVDILEREIQDESAELSQHLSTDQFPGFSVETVDADVKLSKQVRGAVVTVRFTVSSSLHEWTSPQTEEQTQSSEDDPPTNSRLLSMPDFQVQICKNDHTLEVSCFFEENDVDEETGETMGDEPTFGIDELVLYSGEPKETEFAVSAEYFQEDLQVALLDYLANHDIDDNFAKNLVEFATSYEKKQYIGLLKRLKNFVSK